MKCENPDVGLRDFFSGLAETFKRKGGSGDVRVSNDVTSYATGVFGRTKKPEANMKTLADEGYRRNIVLHSAINLIANTVSEPELVAKDSNKGEELPPTHPLNELLWMPDRGFVSKNQLLRQVVISLKTLGNAYIHKGRGKGGQVVRLRHVRADRIEIVPDKATGEVSGYEYKVGSGEKAQVIDRGDMIHVKLFDPLDDYYGLSPMTVAAKFGDLDSEAALYMRDFFINGAMPAGLLKVKTKTTRQERADAREQWKETYGKGTRGRDVSSWFNVGVIDQDVDYQPLGQGPAEMRLDGIWNITESRLCMAVGVPPILVQSKLGIEKGTYANYETARRAFWEETLVPMYGLIADTFTTQLAYEFSDDIEIEFDMTTVQALQESNDAKVVRVVSLHNAGIITRDEAREQTGHEDGDVDVMMLLPGAIDASTLKEKLTQKAEASGNVPPQAGAPPDPNKPEAKPEGEPVAEPDPNKADGAEPDPAEGEAESNARPVLMERFLRERRRARETAKRLA